MKEFHNNLFSPSPSPSPSPSHYAPITSLSFSLPLPLPLPLSHYPPISSPLCPSLPLPLPLSHYPPISSPLCPSLPLPLPLSHYAPISSPLSPSPSPSISLSTNIDSEQDYKDFAALQPNSHSTQVIVKWSVIDFCVCIIIYRYIQHMYMCSTMCLVLCVCV